MTIMTIIPIDFLFCQNRIMLFIVLLYLKYIVIFYLCCLFSVCNVFTTPRASEFSVLCLFVLCLWANFLHFIHFISFHSFQFLKYSLYWHFIHYIGTALGPLHPGLHRNGAPC